MSYKQSNNSVAAANSRTTQSPKLVDRCPQAHQDIKLLRPITFHVMNDPSIDNLRHLTAIVNQLPEKVDGYVMDYIIYPLAHHLKINRNHKEDTRIAVHKCAEVVLKKWQVESFPVFAELYQFCIISICKTDDLGNFDKTLSEIYVEHVIRTIKALIGRSLTKHFKKLYSERYIAAVGQGICILLQIANMETTKSLRIMAIQTVVLLLEICEGDEEACHRIFKFLPGMATTFVRCSRIQGGRYQADIIKESLKALETAMLICISYEKVSDLESVDMNLSPGITEISEDLIFHSEKRLRVALAHFTRATLEDNQTKKLPRCSETLWNNALIFGCGDDDKEANSRCLALLTNPENQQTLKDLCSFKEIDHRLKKAVVLSNIGEPGRSCQCAYRVTSSLMVARISLKEFRTLLPRIIDLRTTVVRRQIGREAKEMSVDDFRLVKSCMRMCEVILATHKTKIVITEFLSQIENLTKHDETDLLRSGGGIHLLNELLEHLVRKKSQTYDLDYFFVENIVDKYLTFLNPLPRITPEVWSDKNRQSLSTSKKKEIFQDPSIGPTGLNFGIYVHTSCILAGLAMLTKLEPVTLSIVIFPLIEYAGLVESEYEHIAAVAEECILKVSEVSKNPGNVKGFLAENLDLIMSEFGSRTESMADCPDDSAMSAALIYLAKYFDFSQNHFLNFVEDIIKLSTVKNLDIDCHEMFSNIYYAYTLSMWTHYYQIPKMKEQENKSETTESKPSLSQRLLEYQRNYISLFRKPEDEFTQENIDGKLDDNQLKEPEAEDDAEGKSKVLKPEISLTLKIANKAVPYLTYPGSSVKLVAMDVLIKSIEILSTHEDELLPLLHSCWTSLTSRFEEKELVVLRKSFELLLTMAKFSGTFLRRRAVEGIFPIIGNFLEDLAELSKDVDEKNTVYYTYTQSYKLQLTIITGLSDLCEVMQIGERELDKIVDTCLIYVEPDQHKNLKEAAINLMRKLGNGHCGSSIWMKLYEHGIVQVKLPLGKLHLFTPLPVNTSMVLPKKKLKKRKGK